jgi:hypothetical protein
MDKYKSNKPIIKYTRPEGDLYETPKKERKVTDKDLFVMSNKKVKRDNKKSK